MGFSRFFRRRAWDEERAREIDSYISEETAEHVARGMAADKARYAAVRKFGNRAAAREQIYDFNTVTWLESLWQDFFFGVRLLRKNPGFATVAILSLALGIGANAAIFDLLNAVRLRSLPIAHPEELAEVRIADMSKLRGNTNYNGMLTNPLWERIRDRQQTFSGVFAWGVSDFNLARGGEVRNAHGLWVSGDFFRVLGVQPLLGRVFTSADDQRGCGAPGAVVSEGFWRRELGSDPRVVDRTISLDNHPVPIIGVTPANFFGLEVGRSFDVAVPICSQPVLEETDIIGAGTSWWLTVMGRLRPGVSLAQATAQLTSISPEVFRTTLAANYPRESVPDYLANKLYALPAGGGVSGLRNDYSASLAFLLGLAGLVLLIACANLANLMLARAGSRQREIAVRLSLGASRARVVRQLLSEAALIALAGTILGALLASYVTRVLVAALSATLDLAPDWRGFAFMAALAVTTTLLFGISPAIHATRGGPAQVLAAFGRGLTAGRKGAGMRRSLAVAQVALSLVLLVGALLFTRSLRNILAVNPGFQRSGIVVAEVDYSPLHLPPGRWFSFETELLDRVRAIPGVEAAAGASSLPVSGNGWSNLVWSASSSYDHALESNFTWVSSAYFNTFNTRLIAGREFDERDAPTSTKVAIVNREFVRRLSLVGNPIGQTFWRQTTPYAPQMQFQIVGVVDNTKYFDVREPFRPIAFIPTPQFDRPRQWIYVIVRSRMPMGDTLAAVRRTVSEAAPLASFSSSVFEDQFRDRLLRERLMAELSAFFGLLAALLAVVGIYGLMSYLVTRRTNEIGVRMALGADRRNVITLILREAAILLMSGLSVGATLALIAGRAATAMLFGLKPSDPIVLAAAVLSLAAVSLAASYLPARRASKLDPVEALRAE
jgi:predicted permease